MTALLSVRGLVKRFGGILVSDNIDFDVRPGEIHALIGPNGAGKTTFINLLSGELRPNGGRISFEGHDITELPTRKRALLGLVRSYQITSVFPELTALQNIMLAVQGRSTRTYEFLRAVSSDRQLTSPAHTILDELGLGHSKEVKVSEMAYGQRRQLELAMVLAMQPKLMLLDEPLAGMSGAEADAMVAFLGHVRERCSVVLIEHDMDAVFSLADRVTVLVYGKPIASGTPEEIQQNDTVRSIYLGDETIDDFAIA
ncbi:ABC transporter ATP-binding protein [Pseudorhodoplanes sp.]|uniref:ABC transporter ATP-binding protein n=1 Tax=Pseudorhodoplanes sp. TaxID=1934341 RepID=UPI003D0988C2